MAYTLDQNGDVVIQIDSGIASDPYSGTSDAKGVNLSTIPHEASVSFAGNQVSSCPTLTGITGTTSVTGNMTFTTTTPLEVGQSIYLTSVGSSGLFLTQVYWISVSSYSGTTNTVGLTITYGQTGTYLALMNGTIVFSTFTLTLGIRGQITKNYMVESQDGKHWIADSNGFVWTDKVTTNGGTGITKTASWTYTGNVGQIGPNADVNAFGNGLIYFQPQNNSGGNPANFDGYLFLCRQQQLDYVKVVSGGTSIGAGSLSWVYDWGAFPTLTLENLWGSNVAYPHEMIQTPDGRIVFTDAYILCYFYQTSIATNFDPTNSGTYTEVHSASSATMPPTDIGLCIAYNPTQQLIVGGTKNIAYVFDDANSSAIPYGLNSLCLIPESVTRNVITVGNNTYLFTGNRGRIYIYNGSQATPLAKVPDHLSNSVMPQFDWGAVTSVNNILYFGIYLTAGAPSNTYGGVWAYDLSSQGVYTANNLTMGYNDYCTALLSLSQIAGDYAGNGFIAGWYSPNASVSGNSGIFFPVSNTPYTNSQSWVTTELIPIGTLLNPETPLQIEFKLSKPLGVGETIQLLTGKYLDATYASFTSQFTTTTTGIISDSTANHSSMLDEQFQWIIVQAVLTSTVSSPSYCPLTQIRIVQAGEKITGFYGLQ